MCFGTLFLNVIENVIMGGLAWEACGTATRVRDNEEYGSHTVGSLVVDAGSGRVECVVRPDTTIGAGLGRKLQLRRG